MSAFFKEIVKGSPICNIYISVFVLILLFVGFFTHPEIISTYIISLLVALPFLLYEKKLLQKYANEYANYAEFSKEEKKGKFNKLYLPFITTVIIFLLLDIFFDLEVITTNIALLIIFVPEQLEIHRIIKKKLGEEVNFNFAKTTVSAFIFTIIVIFALALLKSVF